MTFDPEYEEPVKIVNDAQQSPRLQSRADDTLNDSPSIKVTLYTIDNAILKYMSERIKPIVTQNDSQVRVPVVYGDPERWKSAQRDGVMRDSIGKIQLPMIMIRRTQMKKTIINSAVNKYYDRSFYSGWNRRTPYDQFSVINSITPSREYYNTTATPDYYEITYRCMVWTEYMEQMNSIVENISFESDEFWGERNSYKFRTMIDSFETLTELPNNSDRVVRTQFDMKVHAYLLPESQLDVGGNKGLVTKKRYGIKRTVAFSEVLGGQTTNTPRTPTTTTTTTTTTTSTTTTSTTTTSTTTTTAPPIIYTALDIAAAELSYYVLRSDNTLWSWGWNGEGELGLGDNTDRALPTQVSGSWESISVGAYSLLAIKTDNTLWAAGLNWHAQLGVGDKTNRNTMTQVTGTGWEKVSTATGYGDHTLAVKTDGTLWAWGSNTYGQLGTGSSGNDQLTPVQVGSDTNWSYVHAGYDRSFAIKTNGTLWSWGSNLSTALGQGNSNPVAVYVTPTQVGTDTNWTKLSSGWAFTFALKSNGTLWVTGTNVSYGLGVGSTNTSLEYNTFTQVGSATDWADISCGYEQCVARKTDGSIYTWGSNVNGELGLGDTTNRASPTPVGSATDWTDISGGFYDALAVKNNVLTYWGWNYNDYLGTGNEPELSPVSLPYSSTILY